MSDFNFTATYDFNNCVLVANTTVNINDQVYKKEIPFIYGRGFTLRSVLNTIDKTLTFKQKRQIKRTLMALSDKVRADINYELLLPSINIISHNRTELKFYLNFMDYCFTCKHYTDDDNLYILQEPQSSTDNSRVWVKCGFLKWADIVFSK